MQSALSMSIFRDTGACLILIRLFGVHLSNKSVSLFIIQAYFDTRNASKNYATYLFFSAALLLFDAALLFDTLVRVWPIIVKFNNQMHREKTP